MKSRKACIKTKSIPASLALEGQGIKFTTVKWFIRHFNNVYNALCLPQKILHKHCFQFILGLTIVSREIETMLIQNFWKQSALRTM